MTKRLSSKLLSVILTLAICATTVFGCLMTVSAASTWAYFSDGTTTNADLSEASIKLTVSIPEGAEDFTATQDGKTYGGIAVGLVVLDLKSDITFDDVKVDGGTKVDNTDYDSDADEFACVPTEYGFTFESFDTNNNYYSTLTFELSFTLKDAENGEKFSVTASSVEIGAGAYNGEATATNVIGTITAGCAHKLVGVGDPIQTDTVNGYAVYSSSVCSLCDTPFTDPQVVPTKLPGEIEKLVYFTEDEAKAAGSESIYYDSELADNGETGADWEHAIIIDSALELSYLARYAGDETKDMYYKVADGISGFDMSGGKIDLDGTLEENLDAITGSGKRYDCSDTTYFQGHFDGNGATVYGLWPKYDENDGPTPLAAGLFAYAKGDVEIKNVNVSLSYLKAKYHAGGIVGAYTFNTTIGTNDGNKLIIENCSVTESHIETTAEGTYGYAGTGGIVAATGAIYGGARCYGNGWDGVVRVSNCFINLDETHFVSVGETDATVNSIHGGIGGVAVSQRATFDNCVVIGIAPYSVYNTEYTPAANIGNAHQHTFYKDRFSNIYTTAAVTGVTSGGVSDSAKTQDYTGVMYQISASQIKGADAKTNMPNLAWGEAWEVDVNRGYPNLVQDTTDVTDVDPEDVEFLNGISTTSDFELTLIGTNITYNNGGDYNYNFYYRPNTTEYEPVLYVAQLSDDDTLGSFHRLTGTELKSSPVEGVEAGDICYTIERLSAREIYNTLLATAVVVKDGNVLWGETDKFSIAEYEQAIIDGAYYSTADKNLAEAVLKYGEASAAALNTKNDATSGTTIYWDGTKATQWWSDGDGASADDPIIISTAEQLAYLASTVQADGKYFKIADGIDKIVLQGETYYKDIVALDSAQAVKEYFESKVASDIENQKATLYRWVSHNYNTANQLFTGNFDGNGVEIYGMYCTDGTANKYNSDSGYVNSAGGLFCNAKEATISNLTLKNSYANIAGSGSASWEFGLIVSYGKGDATTYCDEVITAERCTIANNYIYKNVDANVYRAGIVFGQDQNDMFSVQDCLIYGNIATGYDNGTSKTFEMPVIGGSYNLSGKGPSITNSVVLDTPVLATYSDGTVYGQWRIVNCTSWCTGNFTNLYTDWDVDNVTGNSWFDTDIFKANIGGIIETSDVMGVAAIANMPNLDWTGTWCYTDTYPTPAKGTYSTSSSAGKTIYWDGTVATGFTSTGSGDSAKDPIIINTAAELAYLATAKYDVTNGKYFKIADGIDKIVLQSETYGKDIVSLDSAEAVKDYFEFKVASDIEAGKATLHGWASYTWKPVNSCFSGNLDGNGVEIYGMYHSTTDINSTINRSLHGGASGGGLFSVADGATISNLAIKNSYAKLGQTGNTHTNYSFGLIVAFGADGDSEPDVNVISNCTLANNYVYKQVGDNALGRAGLVCGAGNADTTGYSTSFIMQNLLVYGNIATGYMTGSAVEYKLGLAGGNLNGDPLATDAYKTAYPDYVVNDTYMSTVLENSVVLGTPLLPTDTAGTTIKYSKWLVLNAINDSNNNYKNVYTDWDVNNITDVSNFNKDYFLQNCGGVVTESDLIGDTEKAKEIVNTFNDDNGNSNGDYTDDESVWYTGNGALLGFTPPTEMIASAQAVYDAITITSANRDNYGDSDMQFGIYATALNLKTNPYIAFAFAFNGDYKRDRQNISVTFTYTVGDDPNITTDNEADIDETKEGIQLQKTTTVPAYEEGKVLNQDGWTNTKNAGRYHTYQFEDIPVEALCSPIEVTVKYNGDVAEKRTVSGSFSVQGFGYELVNAYKQTPCDYYATRIEAVKALLFYTQMLEARYTSTHPVV